MGLKVLCLLSFKKVGVKKEPPRPKVIHKVFPFQQAVFKNRGKNSCFQGFQPFSTQSVEKNYTAVFRAAINIHGLFHGFNTPYYYYENS